MSTWFNPKLSKSKGFTFDVVALCFGRVNLMFCVLQNCMGSNRISSTCTSLAPESTEKTPNCIHQNQQTPRKLANTTGLYEIVFGSKQCLNVDDENEDGDDESDFDSCVL